MPDLRLIRAEMLKLRRRRGMLAVCAVLTLVAVALYYAVLAVLHLTDPRPRPGRRGRPLRRRHGRCWP